MNADMLAEERRLKATLATMKDQALVAIAA